MVYDDQLPRQIAFHFVKSRKQSMRRNSLPQLRADGLPRLDSRQSRGAKQLVEPVGPPRQHDFNQLLTVTSGPAVGAAHHRCRGLDTGEGRSEIVCEGVEDGVSSAPRHAGWILSGPALRTRRLCQARARSGSPWRSVPQRKAQCRTVQGRRFHWVSGPRWARGPPCPRYTRFKGKANPFDPQHAVRRKELRFHESRGTRFADGIGGQQRGAQLLEPLHLSATALRFRGADLRANR